MSRLWFLYAHPEIKFDKVVFCLLPYESHHLTGNYKELFDILELTDKIEFISCPTAYSKVIVPDLSWSLQHHYSAEFNLVFDAIIEKVLGEHSPENNSYPKKIFFTRSKLEKSKNTEIGIEMLDDFFGRNGFEVIPPENLSLKEMVVLMQNAEIIAGASGSTVHNILFGKYNQQLIIAERNVINNDFQPGINLVRHIDAIYIDSFLTVNSVNSGLGPFLYYPTLELLKFAEDHQMVLPSEKFMSEEWLKKKLRRYFAMWKKFYHRQWYFQKCALPEMNAFYEAYSDSLIYTNDYLRGNKTLFFSDHLSVTRFAKRAIKNRYLLDGLRKLRNLLR